MPLTTQVHVDRPLTMMSVGYMAALTGLLSDKVFPLVPVSKRSDTYFVYDAGDFNRADAAERAPGSEPNYGDYDVGTATPYYAREWERTKLVTDEERANSDDPLMPDEDAMQFATRQVALKKERDFASNFFTTGVWGTDEVGGTGFTRWDDTLSDPAADVVNWSRTVTNATFGYKPNVLAIGAPVYDVLRTHPSVRDAIKYTNPAFAGDITPQLLAGYFGVERVVVGDVVYEAAKKGGTSTPTQIYGKSALLVYAAPNPGLRTITGGATFAWDGGTGMGRDARGMNVRRWREEARRGDAIQCSAFIAHHVVAASAGLFASQIIT